MSAYDVFINLKHIETQDEIKKIEHLICAMQENDAGITFKSQKVFLTNIPAAVSGDNLICWIENFLKIDDTHEAAHIASVLLLYGYIYPLTDYKSVVVKDDPTAFYRFQAPYYWLSKIPKPDAMDYAIYLVKRTLRKRQKYGLEEYEQSALHRLQNMLAQKWVFICMQAADQVYLYKDKRKSDQIVLEAQERAFWRVHQPPPNKNNRFEERPTRNRAFKRKSVSWRQAQTSIMQKKFSTQNPINASEGNLHAEITGSQITHLKMSSKKSMENLMLFTSNRCSYDWFLRGQQEGAGSFSIASMPNGPAWLTQPSETEPAPCVRLVGLPTCDALLSTPLGSSLVSLGSITHTASNTTWCQQVSSDMQKNIPTVNQVRLWGTSFDNLLWDPKGCHAFKAFLEKEFSAENIRFWLAVNAYQFGPISGLRPKGEKIFEDFLAENAASEINIDSTTMAATALAMQNPSWFTFEDAKQHIYNLMKSDSYVRFLRSDDYSAMLCSAINYQSNRKSVGKTSVVQSEDSNSMNQRNTSNQTKVQSHAAS